MDVGVMSYHVKSYLETKKPNIGKLTNSFCSREDVEKQKRNVSLLRTGFFGRGEAWVGIITTQIPPPPHTHIPLPTLMPEGKLCTFSLKDFHASDS